MNLFFIQNITNNILTIGFEETIHLVKVLRMKKNDKVYLTDGLGNLWQAIIYNISKYETNLIPLKHYKNYGEKNYKIHLCIAPTKSLKRFKWILEKSVEMGVDQITPLLCQHSEKIKINIDRSIKILHTAVKQSFRAYIPKFNHPLSYLQFIQSNKNFGNKFIAHCNKNLERELLKNLLMNTYNNKYYTILIGPEGDFSFEEINMALTLGWQGVQLSTLRLRTDTAAVFSLCAISMFHDKNHP